MDSAEIHEHKIDGAATVFFFARTDRDDRNSAAAYERATAKISADVGLGPKGSRGPIRRPQG